MRYVRVKDGLLALVFVNVGFLVLTGAVGPAAAQPTNETTPTGGEAITDSLTLVSAEYNEGNATAVLSFQADKPTAVTLTDAGAFQQGGEIPQRTAVVDGQTSMQIPVTEVDGMVGVTVSAGNTLYAVPIDTTPDANLFSGDPTWQDMQIAGFSGFAGGLLIVGLVAWRRVRSDEGEVERVL
jgi:hypothetical protein